MSAYPTITWMQPIILLHGALGAASTLFPLRGALAHDVPVHVLDFSGHGEAVWPKNGFGIETFEQDVINFMDALRIETAHIFGYSMGGFVGLRLAARMPQRVASLTTLAMKLAWDEATSAKEAAALDADIIENKAQKFVAALAGMHTGSGWRKVTEGTQQMIGGMHRYRFTDDALSAINVPVQLTVGDRDKLVSIDETLAAYRLLPRASFAVLPHTPHPLPAADPQMLAHHILSAVHRSPTGPHF